MLFIVLSIGLGYLILQKLDESDLYITKREKKSRQLQREIGDVTNVFHKGKWRLHKEEKTDLGIPVKYWIDDNGLVIRTYGDNLSILGK